MRQEEYYRCDVIIVGAGAAGQMAAISAAQKGNRVVLIEQMSKPGMKLLATGGGRCNITRMVDVQDFESAFGRQGRFMDDALHVMGPQQLRDFLKSIGVATKVESDGRVYPVTDKAMTVQAALRHSYEKLGTKLMVGKVVESLITDGGKIQGVAFSGGGKILAEKVLLTCGGRSWPSLGGNGGGYPLAVQAGHSITSPTPTLVPLIVQERWVAQLAGVALPSARVWIDLPKQNKSGIKGDVLFTHRGLTGPAVLDISGNVAELLSTGQAVVPLRVELLEGMNANEWRQKFEMWRTGSGKKFVTNLLREFLPASLCDLICDQAAVPSQSVASQISSACRDKLVAMLAGLELTVTSTEGFDTAFVTRGGVKLKEVKPTTLESRIMPGLYFAGELLDLDGPCGGFNLQWAFASGYLAGMLL